MNIQNNVAVVSDDALTPYGLATQIDQFAGHMTAGHGYDLYRKREGTQRIHPLALIGDTNEALRDRRNDFLPGQCCTAALDQLQAMVGFISTNDIQVNAGCGIQINNRKSQCL